MRRILPWELMTQNATNLSLILPLLFCFLSYHHFIQEREMPCTTIQSLLCMHPTWNDLHSLSSLAQSRRGKKYGSVDQWWRTPSNALWSISHCIAPSECTLWKWGGRPVGRPCFGAPNTTTCLHWIPEGRCHGHTAKLPRRAGRPTSINPHMDFSLLPPSSKHTHTLMRETRQQETHSPLHFLTILFSKTKIQKHFLFILTIQEFNIMKKVRGWGKLVLHRISFSSSDSSMQDACSQVLTVLKYQI